MYCPRCGRQPITDELRFCSYCGFKLGVVKAALADCDDAAPAGLNEVRTLLCQPRTRDISIGVILMLRAPCSRLGSPGWLVVKPAPLHSRSPIH